MQLTKREAEKIFRILGIEPKRNRHHVAGFLIVDGKVILGVHYSFGRGEMPANVPEKFRRSLYLSQTEFQELRRSRMTREQYIQLLRDKGVIPAS